MFSSPLARRRGDGTNKEIATPRRETTTMEPVEEFHYLLDRLICLIDLSKEAFEDAQKGDAGSNEKSSSLGLFRRNRKNKDNNKNNKDKVDDSKGSEPSNKDDSTHTTSNNSSIHSNKEDNEQNKEGKTKNGFGTNDDKKKSTTAPHPSTPKRSASAKSQDSEKPQHPSSPPPMSSRPNRKNKGNASFIHITEEDECVEIIRRIAELVIIGERVLATQMAKDDNKRKHQQKKGWGSPITEDEDDQVDIQADEKELEPGSEAYIGIFDLFFERNGLGMIVDILTGEMFRLNMSTSSAPSTAPAMIEPRPKNSDNPNSGEGEAGTTDATKEKKAEPDDLDQFQDAKEERDEDTEDFSSNTIGSDDLGFNSGAHTTTSTTKEMWRLLPSLKIATQAVQSVSILVQNVSRATSLYFILSNNHINELIGLPLDLYAMAERNLVVASRGNAPVAAGKFFATPELQELTTHFVTFLKSLAMRMNTETLQFYLRYPNPSMFDQDENASEETKAKAIEFPLYARALDFCAAHHDSFVRVTAMNICLNTLRLTTVVPAGEGDEKADVKQAAVGSSPDGVLHNASPLPFRERLAIATHTCSPSRVTRLASPIFTKLSTLWCSLQEKFLDLDTPPPEEPETERSKKSSAVDPVKERERKHNAFKDAAATLQDQLLLLDDLLKVGLTALNEQIIEMMLATFVYPLLLQPLLVYYQRLPSDSGEAPPMQDPFSTNRALDRSTVDFNQVGRAPPEVTAPAKTALFTLASVFHLITNMPLLGLLYTALFNPLAPNASGETVISAEGCVTTTVDGKTTIRIDKPIANKKSGERETYPFGGKENEKASSSINPDVESCVFVLSPALAEVLQLSGGMNGSLANTRPNPYRRALLQCLEVPHHMSDFRKLAVHTVDAGISLFDGEFLAETLLGKDSASFGGDVESKLMKEVVNALCASLVNGKPGPFGTWKLKFDPVAAHALFCATWKCPDALRLASQIVEERYWLAAELLSEIPARIPTTQHLGSIMNLVFYDAASKRRRPTFSDLYYLKNTAPERFSTSIANSGTFSTLCNRSFEAPPTPVLLNKFNEHTAMDLGSSSCKAMLKLDALTTFLKHVSKDNSSIIQHVPPSGFSLTSDRGLVDLRECFVDELKRSIHSYLSLDFCNALTDAETPNSSERPLPGSIVGLSGRTAMPCVCEAPSNSDLSDGGAKMVVEGITWQSLYLVFFGSYMVLAEPAAGSVGSGRVVSSCQLARLSVARDPNPPADPTSPARRLLIAYKWFDMNAPGLFVYDDTPKEDGYGPFNRVKLWRSKLDVWFEDDGAAAHAYHSIHFQIDKAKTRRGDRILDFLTQHLED